MERLPASRVPGQLHTPTQSFSDPPANATPVKSNMHDSRQFKEDYDNARSRLTDQKFDMRDYPDPLLPRDTPSEKYKPKSLTAETEKRLLDLVDMVKGTQH
ncbi:hypothetical protein BJ170DRAFT_437855 [Xylariales sp. AK1849]|nr:hypothetical protein BJ170DRAFT_437855 [Xylariales sp. AK1849]